MQEGGAEGSQPGGQDSNKKGRGREATTACLNLVMNGAGAACRRAELRDHSREVRLAASKGEPKGNAEARCAPRFAGGSAKRHAGHQVFQPSGRFY